VNLLPALIFVTFPACSGGDSKDTADTSADTTSDSGDTSEPDVEPVWTTHRVGTSSSLNGVYASGEGVYVVGTGGHAWVGGASDDWTAMDPQVDGNDLTDLWGSGAGDSLTMYATASAGYVAHFTGGAWSAEDLGTPNHEGIGGSGPEALYAVSWGGIYHWDGVSWTFERAPDDAKLNAVYAVGDEAIAVGEGGAIVHRASDGTWSAMDSGVTAALHGVAGSSMSDVWAVGDDGVVLHYTGAGWEASDAGVTAPLWAVFVPAPDSVFVVGNNGTAITFDGTAWSALPTGVVNNLYAIHGVSATNMWAVGNTGVAIQYKP
jgi:hypothetical protein